MSRGKKNRRGVANPSLAGNKRPTTPPGATKPVESPSEREQPLLRPAGPFDFSLREKILLLGILLVIYPTAATWGHFDFSSMMGFYQQMADAFQKGQLYLDVRPDQVIIHDLIPYEGRYYLQWGPFPAILHLIGNWTGVGLTDRVVCVLAGWLTCVVFFLMVATLGREYFPQVPKGVYCWFLFAFALATPVTLVSFRGTIYHESIAVAVLGIMVGCSAFLRYLQTTSARWIWLCGVAIAAAVATRVSLVLYGLVFGCALVAFQLLRKHPVPKALSHVSAYGIPILVSGGLLMAYNQARFGSPWDYGNSYIPRETAQLAPFDVTRVPENLRHYLLAPVGWDDDYPWLLHEGWTPLVKTTRAEDMSSLFIASPFLFLALGGWSVLRDAKRKNPWPPALRIFVAAAVVSSLSVFALMMTFAGASRRYAHDFVPIWMTLAFVGVGVIATRTVPWRRWLTVGWLVIGASAALHAHLVFTRLEPADINMMRTFVSMSPYARKVLPTGPRWNREEAIARNDLGTTHLKEGRLAAAVEQFEEAAKLLPNEPRIERNLQIARRMAQNPR